MTEHLCLNKKVRIDYLEASLYSFRDVEYLKISHLKTGENDSILLSSVRDLLKEKNTFVVLGDMQVHAHYLIEKWMKTFPEYLI